MKKIFYKTKNHLRSSISFFHHKTLVLVLHGELVREGDGGDLMEDPVAVLAADGFQVLARGSPEHGDQTGENLI